MATVDLGLALPRDAPVVAWSDVPRRLTLTLPELRLAAERAGGAPLPFDLAASSASGLDARLGASREATARQAYDEALAGLHDPRTSLERRGLLDDAGLAGAIGLLATPRLALDIDVAVDGVRARSWHRHAAGALATLATGDGIVFEIGWSATAAWPGELARVAVLPDPQARDSRVPGALDLPYELLDAATEAVRTGRTDLLPVLAGGYPGGADVAVLTALATESHGRLRVLASDVTAAQTVGVVSWTLLADRWHALRPHLVDEELWVSVEAVSADDLAAELAPVIAEVAR